MTDTPKLKPKKCPWCGKKPAVDEVLGVYAVYCTNHRCRVISETRRRYKTTAAAINAWNRRAKP